MSHVNYKFTRSVHVVMSNLVVRTNYVHRGIPITIGNPLKITKCICIRRVITHKKSYLSETHKYIMLKALYKVYALPRINSRPQ